VFSDEFGGDFGFVAAHGPVFRPAATTLHPFRSGLLAAIHVLIVVL